MKVKHGMNAYLRGLTEKLDAGHSMLRALEELVSEQNDPTLRSVSQQIADSIRNGSNLSSALAKHPGVFDPDYVGLIRVFEDHMAAAMTAGRNMK